MFKSDILNKKIKIKTENMERLAEYRDYLLTHPKLTYLFVELTDCCNLSCIHCGSNCEKQGQYIETSVLLKTLREIADDFEPEKVMVCLSGGEPLLHKDFWVIAEEIIRLGFPWGITTNGTLIDKGTAIRLKQHLLSSITISVDGNKEEHERLRGSACYDRTVRAVSYLNEAGIPVQVTTVIHKNNINTLEEQLKTMLNLRISSWRLINIEPIGRALNNRELLLDNTDMIKLLEFVREKRFDRSIPMDIRYGCLHYLSFDYEHELRDNYFLCGSGILVGSILCNGDIFSCLDIERRPELVQGNIYHDRFSKIWKEEFKEFRVKREELCENCRNCSEKRFCAGDSTHTWDFDNNRPMFCFKEHLSTDSTL